MGFWKTLGKIGLKVAPYAAMAIPGVGIPLGMAIQGGIGAAQAKASGGSWKNALVNAGIGAGTSAVGGLGAIKGIGPSSGVGAKILKGAVGAGKAGKAGAVGQVLGDIGRNMAGGYDLGPSSVAGVPGQGVPSPAMNMGLGPSTPPPVPVYNAVQAGRDAARKRVPA